MLRDGGLEGQERSFLVLGEKFGLCELLTPAQLQALMLKVVFVFTGRSTNTSREILLSSFLSSGSFVSLWVKRVCFKVHVKPPASLVGTITTLKSNFAPTIELKRKRRRRRRQQTGPVTTVSWVCLEFPD